MKNNLKYKIILAFEAIVLIQLFVFIFISLNIYGYEKLDLTGMNEVILSSLVIVLLILFLFCIFHYIKIQKNGSNNTLDKCLGILFIIYSIAVLISFIYLRNTEEKEALQMKEDIENSQAIGTSKGNKSYNLLKKATIEMDYKENDEFYDRKKAIINQVENSSVLQRYISLVIFNPAYEYYDGSVTIRTEIKYYVGYLELFIVGIVLSIFYFKEGFFNSEQNKKTNIYYDR